MSIIMRMRLNGQGAENGVVASERGEAITREQVRFTQDHPMLSTCPMALSK